MSKDFYYNINGEDYMVSYLPKFKMVRIQKKNSSVVKGTTRRYVNEHIGYIYEENTVFSSLLYEQFCNIDFKDNSEALKFASEKNNVESYINNITR